MEEIKEIFSGFTSLPYLFIGSGISRRYLGLEDWENLLRRFVGLISDNELAFEYYYHNAKQKLKEKEISDNSMILPMTASLIEADFNEIWFKHEDFHLNRIKLREVIQEEVSPFKAEVADYFKSKSNIDNIPTEYNIEIQLLKEIATKSINGIITTNYDLLIQNLFADKNYDVYVGQSDLLFSPIDGIREIYKIHGCCLKPNSIVLTYEDYQNFRDKNAYMAAKLLTIFVEHPVIFLGYSIEDPNIISILESIVDCTDGNNIEKLKNRLFFVQRSKTPGELKVTDFVKHFNNRNIPMKRILVNDFSLIYKALLDIKAKYNPRLLKMIKNDIYNIVATNTPSGKIVALANIDDDSNLDKVEFIIGVGMKKLATLGITGIEAVDIFKDVVLNTHEFQDFYDFLKILVEKTIPKELKATSNSLPIFKYISHFNFVDLPETIQRYVINHKTFDKFLNKSMLNIKRRRQPYTSIDMVTSQNYPLNKELYELAFIDETKIDLDSFEKYLRNILSLHEDILTNTKANISSNIRRLIKMYDWLKYGKDWIKKQGI